MIERTVADRFWSKVDKSAGPDGCWLWTGARDPRGYGFFSLTHKKLRGAHRIAYELIIAPIPAGLVIDHLCRNASCVNPGHLEAVTNRENLMRGKTHAAANAAKTHCPAGHEYTPENSRPSHGRGRLCRTCARDWDRRNRAQKKARFT